MPIRERFIEGPIIANMVDALCHTCWSAGKEIYKKFNGYEGSEPITKEEEKEAWKLSEDHINGKEKPHDVVIYHFKNDPVTFNDMVYTDNGLEIREKGGE